MSYLLNFDRQTVLFLNNFKGGFFDSPSTIISNISFLVIIFLIIFLTVLIINKKNGKIILLQGLTALILHFLITDGIIKNFFYRPRPYLVMGELIPLGRQFFDSSFPSGHLVIVTTLLTVISYHHRRFVLPAIFFILAVAFSRVYNSMHYPTDVLIGAFLGVALGLVSILLLKNIRLKLNKN